jgi:hypothetical protein
MVMSQSFLKDQLKRIREMTEQMARVHDHATELSHELERDRDAATNRDPLAEVRDLRIYSSPDYPESESPDYPESDRAEARQREVSDSRSVRRHVARDSRRRRHR